MRIWITQNPNFIPLLGKRSFIKLKQSSEISRLSDEHNHLRFVFFFFSYLYELRTWKKNSLMIPKSYTQFLIFFFFFFFYRSNSI
ncbi:unnamed protein product, partial [Vitis vinifera]